MKLQTPWLFLCLALSLSAAFALPTQLQWQPYWQTPGQWVPNRPAPRTQFFVSLPEFRPVTDPRVISRMVQVLDITAADYASQLKIPPLLRLIPVQSASNAFFSSIHPTLVLAYVNESPDGAQKHPRHTEPIWMHEFGHALFEANLPAFASSFGRKLVELEARSRFAFARAKLDPIHATLIELGVYPIFGQLNRLKDRHGSPVEITALQAQFEEGKAKFMEAREKYKTVEATALTPDEIKLMEDMDKILGAYNELAADFVAVLTSENPLAERNVLLQPDGTVQQRKAAVARDFTQVRKVSDWHDEVTHHFFSPVRSWVWKYCMSGPRMSALRQNQGKALLMKRLFAGIGAEVETRYLNRAVNLDIGSANERLIRAIDAAAVAADGKTPLCHN